MKTHMEHKTFRGYHVSVDFLREIRDIQAAGLRNFLNLARLTSPHGNLRISVEFLNPTSIC